MSRWYPRHGRILPGPLKTLPQAARSPVPVTALAVTSAALAAGFLLIPQVAGRPPASPAAAIVPSVEPKPDVAAAPAPEAVAAAPAEATPAPVALQPVASVAPQAVRPVPPVAVKPAAAGRPVAVAPADRSLFELDLLPVLKTDGADLDIGAAPLPAPAKAATKPARRAAARGTALADNGEPYQP